MVAEMQRVVEHAKQNMPSFITPNRISIIRDLFEEMDADVSLVLNHCRSFNQRKIKHAIHSSTSKQPTFTSTLTIYLLHHFHFHSTN